METGWLIFANTESQSAQNLLLVQFCRTLKVNNRSIPKKTRSQQMYLTLTLYRFTFCLFLTNVQAILFTGRSHQWTWIVICLIGALENKGDAHWKQQNKPESQKLWSTIGRQGMEFKFGLSQISSWYCFLRVMEGQTEEKYFLIFYK